MLYRIPATLLLGLLTYTCLSIPSGIHRYNETHQIRRIEEELRTTLLKLSTTFVSLAASPNNSAFPRRGVCQVEKQSFYSVMGASPVLQLPSSEVQLSLLDREYFPKLVNLHQRERISPSAIQEMSHDETAYWSAFMRCQQNSTVYQTSTGTQLENLDQVSSYYFCFHAAGNSLQGSQPVIVEAVYTPYNMDATGGSTSEEPYITCANFHDKAVAQRRLGMLRYSVYWSSASDGKRSYQQRQRTYVAGDH